MDLKKMVEGSTNTGGNTIAPPTSGNGKDAGTQGLGIAYIDGSNINLRNAPSTSGSVLRKLNSGESYIVWAEKRWMVKSWWRPMGIWRPFIHHFCS